MAEPETQLLACPKRAGRFNATALPDLDAHPSATLLHRAAQVLKALGVATEPTFPVPPDEATWQEMGSLGFRP